MTSIGANLQAVRTRIERAARLAGRPPQDIRLIAVSKTWPAAYVAEAHACGQQAFGENQAQEGVRKILQLRHLLPEGHEGSLLRPLEWHVNSGRHEIDHAAPDVPGHSSGVASPQGPLLRPLEGHVNSGRHEIDHAAPDVPGHSSGVASPQGPLLRPLEGHVNSGRHEIDHAAPDVPGHSSGVASPQGPLLRPLEWHFIGPVQGNKARLISEHFQWVHSVERERIAVRLNDARPAHLPPLQVCLQVNVSGEASKHGVEPGKELELARIIAALPRLRLRGLMTIPEPTPDPALQRHRFALLREAGERLVAAGYQIDTLSMGMSDDFEAAIAEGATMVRVGTAIFGPRRAVNGE